MGGVKRNSRGFREYLTMKDFYGAEVRVTKSSIATRSCVWIFIKDGGAAAIGNPNDGAAHLTKAQARRIIKALTKFIEGQA